MGHSLPHRACFYFQVHPIDILNRSTACISMKGEIKLRNGKKDIIFSQISYFLRSFVYFRVYLSTDRKLQGSEQFRGQEMFVL